MRKKNIAKQVMVTYSTGVKAGFIVAVALYAVYQIGRINEKAANCIHIKKSKNKNKTKED